MVKTEQKVTKRWELTEEGKQVAENGSHEALVYNAIPAEGITQSELMVIFFLHSSFTHAQVDFHQVLLSFV